MALWQQELILLIALIYAITSPESFPAVKEENAVVEGLPSGDEMDL